MAGSEDQEKNGQNSDRSGWLQEAGGLGGGKRIRRNWMSRAIISIGVIRVQTVLDSNNTYTNWTFFIDAINVWSLNMSSLRAPGKYLTLIFCFPDFNRFSHVPAKIESPTCLNLFQKHLKPNLYRFIFNKQRTFFSKH